MAGMMTKLIENGQLDKHIEESRTNNQVSGGCRGTRDDMNYYRKVVKQCLVSLNQGYHQ